MDVEQVSARLTFDVAARQASVEATIDFTVGPADGCPVLDLRQAVDSLVLDSAPLTPDVWPHRDLGGGPGAEMRVLDRVLAAGTSHRLELAYRLATPDSAGAQPIGWGEGASHSTCGCPICTLGATWRCGFPPTCARPLRPHPGGAVVGAGVEHAVLSNGAGRALTSGATGIEYPAHFTSLSPMLVVAPAPDFEIRRRRLALAGRDEPITLLTADHAEAGADAAACEDDIAGWLSQQAVRYGPWAHGSSFIAVLWGAGRGMEYDGATTAAVAALEHEVFHSWFGRGVKPARASDGWIDEAWTSWATSSRRVEEPRFASEELSLDEPPVVLYPPHPWSRHTPTEAYREGARLFAGIAHLSAARAGCAPPWPPGIRPTWAGWSRPTACRPICSSGAGSTSTRGSAATSTGRARRPTCSRDCDRGRMASLVHSRRDPPPARAAQRTNVWRRRQATPSGS